MEVPALDSVPQNIFLRNVSGCGHIGCIDTQTEREVLEAYVLYLASVGLIELKTVFCRVASFEVHVLRGYSIIAR